MITAEMVKTLREKTGARLMDCKHALTSTNGDFEKALDWVKQKNLDLGAATTSKSATEGLLGFTESDGALTIVEMSASTDFATQNQEFKDRLNLVTKTAHDNKIDSVEKLNSAILASGMSVQDSIKELAGLIGENIAIRRVVRVEGNFGYYIHFDHKQGAIVELDGVAGDLAQKIGKDLSMHVVFAKPLYLTRAEVPAANVEREKSVIDARLKDDPKNAGKGQFILDRIVEGQLNKSFSKTVLLDQPYYREEKKTVSKILEELGVKVTRFSYLYTKEPEVECYGNDPVPCSQCRNPDQKGICSCRKPKIKNA